MAAGCKLPGQGSHTRNLAHDPERGRVGASLGECTSCTHCLLVLSLSLVAWWQSGSAAAAKIVALPALTPAIGAEDDIHSRGGRRGPWCWLLDVPWRWRWLLILLWVMLLWLILLWLILLLLILLVLILLLLLRSSCQGFLAFLQLDLLPDTFFLPFEFFVPAAVLIPPAAVAISFSTLVLELRGLLALSLALHPPLCPGPRRAVDDGGAQKRSAAEHCLDGVTLMERQSAELPGVFAE